MADDKSLLEDILDVRKRRFKDALFDNNDSQNSKNNFVSKNKNKIDMDDKYMDLKNKKVNENNEITKTNSGKIIKLEKVREQRAKRKRLEKDFIQPKKSENINENNQKAEKLKKVEKIQEKTVKPTNQNEKVDLIKNSDKSVKTAIKATEMVNTAKKEKLNEKTNKIIKEDLKNQKNKDILFTSHINSETDIRNIMKDVIISLIPAIIAATLVYGTKALLVIVTSVFSAVVTEKLFSKIFLNDGNSVHNLSAIITGILMAFILAPLTSLPVVAFGGSMAIIFGKLMYGGIGRNIFNPAAIGREFMTVFFPVTMSSGTIWFSQEALKLSKVDLFVKFQNTSFMSYLDGLILTSSGSLGSYSAFALILGGLYLLLKNRISWHIPVTLFVTSFIATIFLKDGISVSTSGLLLIGIFMATDMSTSPSFNGGKIYYGIMLGIIIALLTAFGVKNETLSYVLIILNPFARAIDKVFHPAVLKEGITKQSGKVMLLSFGIILLAVIFTAIHKIGAIPYLVYLYILVLTLRLILIPNPIKLTENNEV
ncbi:RnfABCDGE type electron transport complex subunit D [Leptotrichia sp. HSP-342]|uniref:RnfABCDGE type electron transport complex subunit D n=1 Tax=Leptotrichia mesophila TaxID=3239303 RepID=A0AB39V9E7_9FUSO